MFPNLSHFNNYLHANWQSAYLSHLIIIFHIKIILQSSFLKKQTIME